MAEGEKKGFGIIINDGEREGSVRDVEALQTTFVAMNMDCQTFDIQQNIEDIYNDCAEKIENASFVIIAYMSHGQSDGFTKFGYLKRNVLSPLIKKKCLDGKLKWLITQNCCGVRRIMPAEPDGAVPYYLKYYVVSNATVQGAEAYRLQDGSPYIRKICDELRQNWEEGTLRKILENVTQIAIDDVTIQEPIYDDNFPGQDFSFKRKEFFNMPEQVAMPEPVAE